jgi:hypothetical protein
MTFAKCPKAARGLSNRRIWCLGTFVLNPLQQHPFSERLQRKTTRFSLQRGYGFVGNMHGQFHSGLTSRLTPAGLVLIPIVFLYTATHSLQMFRAGIFFAGFTTVAQLTFWGNYLPRVYPVHLRGTGEGFSANVGGRMLGTSAALATTHLSGLMSGSSPAIRLTHAATVVGVSVYVLALGLTLLLPEPPAELPE